MIGGEISAAHVAELARLDLDYWWLATRLAHVRTALERRAKTGDLALLDFGCGTGQVLESLVASLRPRRALGLDGTQTALAAAAARGLPTRLADFRAPLDLPFAPNAILALDVLEHLDDDGLALRHLAAAAAPEALLLVTVPALPSLWTRWDELAGHRRRYTRRGLGALLEGTGWSPRRVRPIFGFCVPAAWLERRVLARVREFEFPRVPPALNTLLTLLGELERRMGCPLPIGTSLLAEATRRP